MNSIFAASPTLIPLSAIKGRGAVSQLAHRFSRDAREDFDDGWGTVDAQALEQGERLPPATQVILEDAKSIITRNDSPDIYFDYSINPYRGCEHGCIYCYARPTHSYLGYSPGLDFETKIVAKRNISDVLLKELASPSYRPHLLNIGSATDCYQPVERELLLTRQVIEVMQRTRHAFSLVTKSSGIERDLDLIVPMAAHKLAAVYVTVTTLDPKLARILEPRAAAPHRRLRVIETLAAAGVPVGVSVAPQIPFINDDMEQVLEAAWAAGARTAFYTVLRLPWELSPLFIEWLGQHYPDRATRVMARVREMRGGKNYDSDFATRMKGHGLWAQLIASRFEKATHRLGFNRQRVELDLSVFQPPRGKQIGLF
jgi:DNA repair photolyase